MLLVDLTKKFPIYFTLQKGHRLTEKGKMKQLIFRKKKEEHNNKKIEQDRKKNKYIRG